MSRAVRFGRLAVPAVVAGLALALSLPPWGWWPLGFVGAAVVYLLLAGLTLPSRFLAGWLVGLGCFVPGLFWSSAFNWYGAAVLMIVEALSMAVAAAAVPARRGRLLALVGAFTLLEALRISWPFGGLPLGGVFLGQAEGPLLSTARLGGPLLLTAEVWLGGAVLGSAVTLAVRWYRGEWLTARALAALIVPLAVVVLLPIGAGRAPAGGRPVGSVAAVAVQGGGRRGTTAEEVSPARVYQAALREVGQVRWPMPAGSPRLVLWPEDVLSLSRPLAGSPQATQLSEVAGFLRTTLLVGVTVNVSRRTFLNEVVAWGPDGHLVGSFEKVHRVPFGEYVPFRGFFSHLADLSAVPRDAIAGHGNGLLHTPAGPLGVMVSFEVFFADRGRGSVEAGAELLTVPTNTSSYASSQVPNQELAADRVQAVQTGRDLVQASPTGYSAVVDPDGTVRHRSALGRPAVVGATVALRRGLTLYDRGGDLPVLLAAAVLLLAGLAWALWPHDEPW